MHFQFIGTGASDYDWSRYGEDGILGSCSCLLDGHVLIDCGPTVPKALRRFGVEAAQITEVVFTHSHSDHFDVDCLRELAGNRRLPVYGPAAICKQVADFCEVHPVQVGECFFIGETYSFHALPANHSVPDLFEPCLLYVIQKDDKTLLYALDSASLSSQAFFLLGKIQLDAVIWDGTTATPRGDRTLFQHSNPETFAPIRQALLNLGILRAQTHCYLSHRSFRNWPPAKEEQSVIERTYDVKLARDGESIEI